MFRTASRLVFQPTKIYRLNRPLAIVSPNSIQSLGLELENLKNENSAAMIDVYAESKDKISGKFVNNFAHRVGTDDLLF